MPIAEKEFSLQGVVFRPVEDAPQVDLVLAHRTEDGPTPLLDAFLTEVAGPLAGLRTAPLRTAAPPTHPSFPDRRKHDDHPDRRDPLCGLTLLEEPCDAKEAMSRRRLVERSPIPVVGDESVPTAGDASRELLSGGCTAICIKTARSGFTEATEILGLCTGLGVDVTMGNQIDTQVGSLATVTFGAAHEATSRRAGELSNFLDMADDLLADPLVISEGRIPVRAVPGVGAEIDEEKLARYRQY